MNGTIFTSQKQENYKLAKEKLMQFLTHADTPFAESSRLLDIPREDSVSAIADKVGNDIFSLVLIGAFQSGKSTLFNYLCDGRELSPVGPGGGGIRTSGCRISAHCIEEDAEEYALISWRSADELLRSLGNKLLPYYAEKRGASGADYLTEQIVNLHDAAERNQLAEYAWTQLKEGKLSGDEQELLRFTLLVCHFFPEFAARSESGVSRHSVQDVVKLTSYPQNWKALWRAAMASGDLSAFQGLVSFAFVAGCDFYLDSAVLRNLGCSVTDCPGLFISKWDTTIAEQCIRQADALLYMFAGDKALTMEDVKALRACVDMGGEYKMLFGANLRISRGQWARIEEESVLPDLKDNGFSNPVIHPFHSGIALRAREQFLLNRGWLDSVSQQGIDLDIRLDSDFDASGDAAADRRNYLKKMLDKYIFNLTNGKENLSNYNEADGQSLETLSGVPDFITSAKDYVVKHKAPSLLQHQGIEVVLRELNNTRNALITKRDWLSSDTETARRNLEALGQQLRELCENKEHACVNICNSIKQHEGEIMQYFVDTMSGVIDTKRHEIMQLFIDNRPGTVEALFGAYDEAELAGNFARGLESVFQEGLNEVKKKVKSDFNSLPAFQEIRRTFEHERNRLVKDVKELKGVPNLQLMNVQLPDNWEQIAAATVVPDSEEIQGCLVDGFALWVDAVITILTFGFYKIWLNEHARAEAFADEYLPQFKEKFAGLLWKVMYTPGAPMQTIWDAYDMFSSSFESALQQANRLKESAERELAGKDTAERQSLIAEMHAAVLQTEEKLREAEAVKAEIQAILAD